MPETALGRASVPRHGGAAGPPRRPVIPTPGRSVRLLPEYAVSPRIPAPSTLPRRASRTGIGPVAIGLLLIVGLPGCLPRPRG
jgi:hypothetical protein